MAELQQSYVHGTSDQKLIGETVGRFFDAVCERWAERPALIVRHQGVRLTYGEFKIEVDKLAAGLLTLGLEPGDRVGIWSPNNSEWVLTQFATAKAGLILVNINPAYRIAELEYALNKVGCKALILAERFKTSEYVGMLRSLAPELAEARPMQLQAAKLPALRSVIVLGDGGERSGGEMRFSELLARGGKAEHERLAALAPLLQFDEPINIQFTSGTTGHPKGATLSHHNILNNGFFIGEAMRLGPEDRLCIPVPLYHCFGMVLGNLACVTHGSAMVFPGEGFDPLATLETVAEERCTALHGVPTMFIAEMDHPEFKRFDFSSLRTGIMAGSPCPIEVMKRVVSTMNLREITIAYGMTETSPVSFQSSTDDPLERRVSTVGRIHPHLEVKIVDAEGRIVPPGTPGELLTRGYSVMLGYWDDETRTRESIDAARWMHTGDLATIDDQGLLQHRRAHQGHGHPRRRERLSPRDRGIPLSPSQDPGRAGHRRARQALRRGAVRLDQAAPRHERDAGRDQGVLPRPDRALQDPALLPLRRRVPHDGDRQDPEIRHAREDDRRARAHHREDSLEGYSAAGKEATSELE